VYWHYRVENVGKRGLAVAGAIVLGLYAICNYNTPVFQEATFRMTSLGRAFPYAPRLSVVACHDAWERDDVGLGTRTGAQMNGCHATKALPETAFDEWCMRIFKEKRPFKDHSELDTCRDRSKRLVGVANWPATRETLSGATIPKS